MKKLILTILLVAGSFAEEDISYSISGNIGSEYKVKFITHFRDQNKKCRGSDLTKEIEVKSGEYNISIPLTHRNENENLCFDYHIVGLELKIITKNVENEYSIFPILGNSTGYGMEICMGNTDSISMATHAIEITKIAKPIYSGFIKNGNEGFRDYQSYAFMPRKLRTSKSIFRLTPKTDFICDTKGLFFTSASLCQMKALLDTNGGLYHYTGEDKNECHSLTHPDFGVDKIENSSLVINVSHEKINDF